MTKLLNAFFALPLLVGACSTSKNLEQTTDAAQRASEEGPARISGDQSLGALRESALPEKSCGMILWTLDDQRPTPIFRYVGGKQGEIAIAERKVLLARTDYNGATGFGIAENQKFASETGLTVTVNTNFGQGFDGGAYLESSLVKVVDAEGSTIVVPAAGVAGCRNTKK